MGIGASITMEFAMRCDFPKETNEIDCLNECSQHVGGRMLNKLDVLIRRSYYFQHIEAYQN